MLNTSISSCITHGRGVCQPDTLVGSSWGYELISETIPISIHGSYLQLHLEVLNTVSMYGRE